MFATVVFLALVAADGGDVYHWTKNPSDPNDWSLFKGDVQVGGYRADGKFYRPLKDGKWGAKGECPAPLPPEITGVPENFGLELDKITQDRRYYVGTREVTQEKSYEAFGKGELADDSGKKFLSVLSDLPETVAKLSALWNTDPAFAELRQRYHFQAYKTSDPMVKGMGFVPESWYFQAPDGKVLARLPADTQPVALAQAVRKADPNYDPAKDPPKTSDRPMLQLLDDLPPWAKIVGLLAIVYLLTNRKAKT